MLLCWKSMTAALVVIAWSNAPIAAMNAVAEEQETLEQQLSDALDMNPQVMMAKAKLHQAEAEYLEVRLRIAQEFMQMHVELETQERLVHQALRELEQVSRRYDEGQVQESEVMHAETRVIQQKQVMSQIQSQIKYLKGSDLFIAKGGIAADQRVKPTTAESPRQSGRPAIPAEFEELLEQKIEASFLNASLPVFVSMINDQVAELTPEPFAMVINYHEVEFEIENPEELMISFKMSKPSRLKEILTAIADLTGLCFVVRDYGILVTGQQQAYNLYAPTIPSDVPLAARVSPGGGFGAR